MDDINNKINKFRYTLINNFNDLDLVNFYSNINNLKVMISSGKMSSYVNSCYDYKTNVIFIYKDKINEESLYHELFHMASNNCLKKGCSDGFYLYQNNKNIGKSLNEGYTELLTRRFFGKENNDYIYDLEVVLANYLEKIIGKKMVSFYLRGNLLSLIEEISHDMDIDDIYYFLDNMDYVSKYLYDDEYHDKIIKKINDINSFLIIYRIKKQNINLDKELLKINYPDCFNVFNIIQDDDFWIKIEKCVNNVKK